jgi:hypothetical protein
MMWPGGGAGFVPDDMRLVAHDDVVARPGQQLEAGLVRHGAARQEEGGLLAQEIGDPLLQPAHRRVLAVLVVANRCLRHRHAHARRRQRHGIRAEVDAVHGGLRPATTRG